ncbi:MAG: translation elongation factor Ts [bacterium]|nr:translation elongation factor Ts [bacterium]
MPISTEAIKNLREKTQAALGDCRASLEEAGGDMQRAEELLRVRGKLIAEKKASRAAHAGIVEAYVHQNGRVGVLVEVRCETDFVARNEFFKALAHDVALQIAAMSPLYVEPGEIPEEIVSRERANFEKEFSSSGKPPEVVKKIVEGKLAKLFEEKSLLTQAFVKDPSRSVRDIITDIVGKLGENVRVERFVRYEF